MVFYFFRFLIYFQLFVDDNESNEDEGDEPEVDLEMGNVDESEEDKLDPDLWDQSDDNEKELVEGSEGLISVFWCRKDQ